MNIVRRICETNGTTFIGLEQEVSLDRVVIRNLDNNSHQLTKDNKEKFINTFKEITNLYLDAKNTR